MSLRFHNQSSSRRKNKKDTNNFDTKICFINSGKVAVYFIKQITPIQTIMSKLVVPFLFFLLDKLWLWKPERTLPRLKYLLGFPSDSFRAGIGFFILRFVKPLIKIESTNLRNLCQMQCSDLPDNNAAEI